MKKRALSLIVGALLLSSCSTNPLYEPPAYDGANFEDNYLVGFDEIGDKEGTLLKEVGLTRAEAPYQDGEAYFFDGDQESSFRDVASAGMKDVYPELFTYTAEDGTTKEFEFLDSAGSMLDNPDTISFGKAHCLALKDDGFKKGVLSKLYNGQLECHSWYANARIQCEESGFKALFPTVLEDGDIFALSLRGNTSSSVDSRYVSADVTVRFYVDGESAYDYYQLTYESALFWINSGGSAVSLVGSSLKDAFGDDFARDGIVGYSVSFSRPEEGYFEGDGEYSFEKEGEGPYFGFSVYEVMLPLSTWR